MKHNNNINPKVTNEIAAKQHQALISNANKVTIGKHNGSKKKKTLLYLSHKLNNQVNSFYHSN